MKSNLKIAFLTSTNPNDKKSWSGIHFFMFQSLKNHFSTVDAIGPIDNLLLKSLGGINKITRFFLKKGYNHNNSIIRSYLLSLTINRKINKKKYDIIFAPAASTEVAFIKTKVPIIYLSDSSFGQLNGYYDVFSNLFKVSIRESNYIEQRGIDKASYFVYPSKWAADYVLKEYNVDKSKLSIVPFGANIDEKHIKYIEKTRKKDDEFKLLFLGVYWERKGGDIVFDTFKFLLEKGYDVSLTICGCVPPVNHEKMKVYPFLNKNIEADINKLTTIIQESHVLFVPTRADCSPIVFCEASAFGLPIITTDTGGVSSVVKDGVNGFCLPISSDTYDYFIKISELINDPDKYRKLSKSSRKRYEEELNWEKLSLSIKDIFFKIKNIN